jgi:hypothetical protein
MNVKQREITEYMDKLWSKSKRQTSEYDGAWNAVTLLGYEISRNTDGTHSVLKTKNEDIAKIENLCNTYLRQFCNGEGRKERYADFNYFIGISNIARFAGFAWFKKKDGNIFFFRKSNENINVTNETALRSFRSLKHNDIIVNAKTGQAYKVIVTITGKVLLTSIADNVVYETKGKKASEFVKVK